MADDSRNLETSAQQCVRRYYSKDHFTSQAVAERAYFRLLAEWIQRGLVILKLQTRLASMRRRNKRQYEALKRCELRERYGVSPEGAAMNTTSGGGHRQDADFAGSGVPRTVNGDARETA